MISKLKRDIFIVVELINPKNVSFLYNKGRSQNDEYLFIKNGMKIDATASFAAGEVYFSSIMDNLLVQAYYNKSLLAVLKKIILGEDQSIYKKPPLNKYRQIVSSNLYLIDNPFDSEEKIRELLMENTHISPDYNSPMNLGTLDRLREEREIIYSGRKPKFQEIFNFMLKKGIVVIGIYRSIDSVGISKTQQNTYCFDRKNSNFFFTYTSPDKKDSVDFKDKLFVLSQAYPENLLETTKPVVSYLNAYEGNPFKNYIASNLKKYEEKKDPKSEPNDKKEIEKIKEVNSLLKEIQGGIDEVNGQLSELHDRIEHKVAAEVKNKINSLYGIRLSQNQSKEDEEYSSSSSHPKDTEENEGLIAPTTKKSSKSNNYFTQDVIDEEPHEANSNLNIMEKIDSNLVSKTQELKSKFNRQVTTFPINNENKLGSISVSGKNSRSNTLSLKPKPSNEYGIGSLSFQPPVDEKPRISILKKSPTKDEDSSKNLKNINEEEAKEHMIHKLSFESSHDSKQSKKSNSSMNSENSSVNQNVKSNYLESKKNLSPPDGGPTNSRAGSPIKQKLSAGETEIPRGLIKFTTAAVDKKKKDAKVSFAIEESNLN